MATIVLISGSFNSHTSPAMEPHLSGAAPEQISIPLMSASLDEYMYTSASMFYTSDSSNKFLSASIQEYLYTSASMMSIPGMELNLPSIEPPTPPPPPAPTQMVTSHDLTRFKKTYSIARFNPKMRRIG